MGDVIQRGEGDGITAAAWAKAVLSNGLGRPRDALAAAERATAYHGDMGFSKWALVELVEAGVRSGMPAAAAAARDRLTAMTDPSATDWGLGLAARSRALLSDGAQAEGCYREAIERLGRTRIRVELARAHLLYGEWLRRENRRADARSQLGTAHEMLEAMGLAAFVERARRELAATGAKVRKRTVETVTTLTAQEAQIARLAGDGNTNAEIGAQLFLSVRTVEWHLGKVFSKLGIGSRRGLRAALDDLGPTA
jgi:DNA-binding CsgD family transcriptional regulator